MRITDFYKRFSKLSIEKRNVILKDIRHDPLTPFLIYKQIEQTIARQKYYKAKEEELLRIAEETFNQVENG